MAVTLTGTGGLFTRLGALIDLVDKIHTHENSLTTEVDDILDEYAGDRDLAFILEQSLPGWRAAAGNPIGVLRRVAIDTLIDMVHADNPLPRKNLKTALEELIDQMETSSDDIDGTTVSESVAADSANTGNATVITSLVDTNGKDLMNVRAEDIVLICTSDAQESGTAGSETFSVKGEAKIGQDHPDWPDGSGISGSLQSTNTTDDGGSGPSSNMTTNGDFETFTVTNTPDSWTVDTGQIGTTITEGSNAYRGSKNLAIVGDGAENTEISQSLTFKPNTKYVAWVRIDTDGAVAAGALTLSIKDSGGTILNNGTSLTTASVAIDLTAHAGSYTLHSIAFETPTLLPTGLKISLEATTPITSSEVIDVDDLSCSEMKQFGPAGGPYMAIAPGSTDSIRDDKYTVTITNNNEGEFVRGLDRFFRMYESGLLIPYVTDGTETVADSLVA